MGFSSFLYHTTKMTESDDVGGTTLQGNDADPFSTAFTVITGPAIRVMRVNIIINCRKLSKFSRQDESGIAIWREKKKIELYEARLVF